MPEKSDKPKKTAEDLNFSDSCFSKSICSSMDCTGLIPALPSSEAELEAYEKMYQFCLNCAPDRAQTSNKEEPHYTSNSAKVPASGA